MNTLYDQQNSRQVQRRQLRGDQDLQLAFDHNQQIQDKQLHDKVLFAVQGLGTVRTFDRTGRQLQAYIKGTHCQQSIKDLVKFIRNDVPDNPKVKLILSNYNIVQTDLIQLLLLQVADKKLSFWIIALLALITNKPSDQLNDDDKQKLFKALRDYKRSFIKHQCLAILTIHIADYFKTETKQKAHYQMLEFIILLFKNLLQIPDSSTDQQSLHNHFLTTLIREEMFNPFLYMIQNQRGQMMDKIDIPLLQIFYYIFTCFDPDLVYKPRANKQEFSRLYTASKINRGPTPLRHSRFLPNFMQKSNVGVNRITHRMNSKVQPITNQRQIPRRTADLKKVQRIQLQSFSQNFMQLQFEANDPQTGVTVTKKVADAILDLCQQFVEVQFPQLSQLVFSQIYKQNAKVTTQNVIQYLLMSNWAIKLTRAKYLKEKAQARNHIEAEQVQFDLAQIANIMQTAHFQLIYKLLLREATRQKKKQFKINTFNAALRLFQNYLNVINDISMSFRPSDRNNANILMANIFRHDIAKIFRTGFQLISHEGILKTLISVCHKFYKLLSKHSNGKVLTIQTNKLLKRKNKKKMKGDDDEQNLKDFISSDSQEDDEDGQKSYQEGKERQQKKKKKQKSSKPERQQVPQTEQPMFQQRKFNEISQFAIIAEYGIISKYLIFLKDQRILSNTDQFNDSIFFFFEQICKLLKGEWLFYQAETLVVFQQILSLSNQLIKKNRTKYVDKIKFIKNICRDFIKLMQKNKLALIESLFNYPSLSLKDKIFKNYDDGQYAGGDEIQQNMFVDKDDDQ